ncbi:MAG: HIT family protein [Candidatus Bathyarchaeota archaeon]|nr:HIT family protein [Candidatus Bathyarchaeota archaeon]
MADHCIFCAIVEGKIPSHKVYEDEKTLAFLDIHPSAPGHTLVIPKAHITRVEDLPEEDARHLFAALHKIVGRIQEAMGAPASTIGINNGRESGQEVPHVHIHVIPRNRGDRGGMIQGVSGSPQRLNDEEMARIAKEIRERIKGV